MNVQGTVILDLSSDLPMGIGNFDLDIFQNIVEQCSDWPLMLEFLCMLLTAFQLAGH